MAIDRRILPITGGCLMTVACILFVISNALPSWGEDTTSALDNTIGLWRACMKFGDQWDCHELHCSSTTDAELVYCAKMHAARAFITIACIVSALSSLCLFTCILRDVISNSLLVMINKSITIISFVVGVIGLATGLSFVTNHNLYVIGSAVTLAIVAVALNLLSAILAVVIP